MKPKICKNCGLSYGKHFGDSCGNGKKFEEEGSFEKYDKEENRKFFEKLDKKPQKVCEICWESPCECGSKKLQNHSPQSKVVQGGAPKRSQRALITKNTPDENSISGTGKKFIWHF